MTALVLALAAATGTVADRIESLARLRQAKAAVERASRDLRFWSAVDAADAIRADAPRHFPAGSPERAAYLELAAHVFARVFRYADADALLREVVDIRRHRDRVAPTDESRVRLAFALYQYGRLAEHRGSLTSCVEHYEESLKRLPAGGRDAALLRVTVLNALAVAEGSVGDIVAAADRLDLAEAEAERLAPPAPGLLAQVRLNAGQMRLALVARFRAIGDADRAADNFRRSARSVNLAGRHYFEPQSRAPNDEAYRFLVLLVQNQCLIVEGKHAQAEASLRRVLAQLQAIAPGLLMEATYRQNLGHALAAQGKHSASEAEYRAAVDILDRARATHAVGSETVLVKEELARVLAFGARPGDVREAATLAREALQEQLGVVERGLAHLSDRQRVLYLDTVRGTLGLYLTLAVDGPTNGAGPPAEDAYARVLAWKGAATARSATDRSLVSLSPAADEEIQACRQDVLNTAGAYRAWIGQPRPAEVPPAQWASEGKRLREAREQAERKAASAHEKHGFRAPRPPTPRQVADALPADTALIDFILYTASSRPEGTGARPTERLRVLAFVSRRGRPTACVPLPDEWPVTLRALDGWYAALRNVGGEKGDALLDLDRHARALARAIWEPIAAHPNLAGAHRILVAPDADLWRVPFAALPVERPNRYLLQERAVTHVFSGRHAYDLCLGRGIYQAAPGTGCLVVGAFRYGDRAHPHALEDVPGGDEWKQTSAAGFESAHPGQKCQTLPGADATAERVLPLLAGRFREVHVVAAHGPVFNAHAGDWRLRLGDDRVRMPLTGANRDLLRGGGPNTPDAAELGGLDLRGVGAFWWWACHLNSGPAVSGEGVIGIPRALHMAGCQASLASLFDVDPSATRNLASRVSKLVWREGLSPAEAVTRARREAIDDDQLYSTRPDYWAGWIMIGDSNMFRVPAAEPPVPAPGRDDSPPVGRHVSGDALLAVACLCVLLGVVTTRLFYRLRAKGSSRFPS